jgi:hypothetical protein
MPSETIYLTKANYKFLIENKLELQAIVNKALEKVKQTATKQNVKSR